MKKILHPANTRGTADYGWLQARYSFSFGNYFNPDRTQFGMLRVLNDDTVAGGMGFGAHPHKDMEIITIPQSGALKHKDSLNNEGIIESGEIQVMSAGSGIEHSEVNASQKEALRLFQIWVFPNEKNLEPRYDQKKIAPLLKENQFSIIVKPKLEAEEGEVWIHQNAYFSLGEFSETTETKYVLKHKNNGIYVFNINGNVIAENETLDERDAVGIWETGEISITVEKGSKVLLIEVPMN